MNSTSSFKWKSVSLLVAGLIILAAAALLAPAFIHSQSKAPEPSHAGVQVSQGAASTKGATAGEHLPATTETGVVPKAPALTTSQDATISKAAMRQWELGTLPPLDKPLAPQIPELMERAKHGDAEAALALWYGLDQCDTAIDESRSRLLKSAGPSFAAVEAALLDNCKDVPPDLMLNYYQWLKLAASLGNPQAQFLYAYMGSAVVGGVAEALRNPEQWMAYRDTARSYMDNLVKQCNVSAISSQWYDYEEGTFLVAPDITKAYMYKVVEKEMESNPTFKQLYQPSLDRIASKMTPDQINKATQDAHQFYNRYCVD